MNRRAGVEPWPRVLIAIEGPPGCADWACRREQVRGGALVEGFGLSPGRGHGSICVGVINSEADATAALLAAIDGAGLILELRADRGTIDRLVDDLRRLGPVDHRAMDGSETLDPGRLLTPDGRAILGLLAEGCSLGQAAVALSLSRRTADRRLAEARRALGTDRTAMAIARARDLGWLGRPDVNRTV